MSRLKHVSFGKLGRPRSAKSVGVAVLVALVLFGVGAFEKERLTTMLTPGETLEAKFTRNHHLVPYDSEVKMAGVHLGTVTDVERTDDGAALVSMKVAEGTTDKLGSEPSAAIRPALLVGGRNYVALTPGGHTGEFNGGPIPVARTSIPVELDDVLSSFTAEAREGVQSTVHKMEKTLDPVGRRSVKSVLRTAPGTLGITDEVLNAARGTRPGTDLTRLVRGLESAGAVLSEQHAQLSQILSSLHHTTATLSSTRKPLAQTVTTLPHTLRRTRAGLVALNGTLDRLTVTADQIRPSIQQLDPLLTRLDPVLVEARPIVHDVRILLDDARPLAERLVPVVSRGTGVLRNVNGPVLRRVRGPMQQTVLSPWHGHGVYEGGGNDNLFYEEVGFLAVDGAKAFQTHDHNGSLGRLMAGVGGRSVGGSAVPRSVEQYLETLGFSDAGPQEGSGSDAGASSRGSSGSMGGNR
jgi:phospholipid/cholesterol/gamma-HCH transport system substrate-binding protein